MEVLGEGKVNSDLTPPPTLLTNTDTKQLRKFSPFQQDCGTECPTKTNAHSRRNINANKSFYKREYKPKDNCT